MAAGEGRAEPWLEADAPLMIAAWGAPPEAHFNGKLEAPSVLDSAGLILAAWDLGGEFAGDTVADTSGNGCDGRCVRPTPSSWIVNSTVPAWRVKPIVTTSASDFFLRRWHV